MPTGEHRRSLLGSGIDFYLFKATLICVNLNQIIWRQTPIDWLHLMFANLIYFHLTNSIYWIRFVEFYLSDSICWFLFIEFAIYRRAVRLTICIENVRWTASKTEEHLVDWTCPLDCSLTSTSKGRLLARTDQSARKSRYCFGYRYCWGYCLDSRYFDAAHFSTMSLI